MPGVLYLHGFCSSSGSSKGVFLAGQFASLGVDVALPDLDGGDFRSTTLSKQLALVSGLAANLEPDLLVGSSLGGYLAALFAARQPGAVPAVALMAPAFDFAQRIEASVGPEMQRWRNEGSRSFFHYRDGREAPLDYGFVEDARRYEPFPDVTVPTRVLHGRNDEVVDPALTIEFAKDRPNVTVEWLPTDHQMLDVTERIWSSLKEFYGQARASAG